jgi:Flp pilus assembly protein TadB
MKTIRAEMLQRAVSDLEERALDTTRAETRDRAKTVRDECQDLMDSLEDLDKDTVILDKELTKSVALAALTTLTTILVFVALAALALTRSLTGGLALAATDATVLACVALVIRHVSHHARRALKNGSDIIKDMYTYRLTNLCDTLDLAIDAS